jgi:ribosome maturation protein Sdo1
MVQPDMHEKYKKDKSIALANVVDSFDVLKYELPGRSGKMVMPSKSEIEEVFGTTKEDEVVKFMLEHGEPHGKVKKGNHGEPRMVRTGEH